MNFVPQAIDHYATAHSQDEPALLQALNKETWQTVLAPRMLSGHLQGRLLSLLAKIQAPKLILEIGTYTGYSALCLAEGLSANGHLHTIDPNVELQAIQRKYFDLSGKGAQITQHLGYGRDIIPTLDQTYDLVFIDADKVNYPNYLELVVPLLNKGGLLISDNVLWSGKVVTPVAENDADTKALLTYNKALNTHDALEAVLLPIRDWLFIARKK